MIAFFTVITIHKKIETSEIYKLSLSIKLYNTAITSFTFSYTNNKLLKKISRKPRTRKDSYITHMQT